MDAEIGVIGGSGLYSLLEKAKRVSVRTRYGRPSSQVTIGRMHGKNIAFIARHGLKHTLPPHMVPYKANIAAMKSLGVERIISTNAVGSLSVDYKPGEFVMLDQFFNMTNGRDDTFFHKGRVVHISTAEPYCNEMRFVASNVARKGRLGFHDKGTVVVINGPRFSTKAESVAFSRMGFDLINMTQYPEVALAREQGMCYLGIAMVTDYDVGLEGNKNIRPVSFDEVNRTFAKNIERVKVMIGRIIDELPEQRKCICKDTLKGAVASS